jgi:hypothetical protein
MSRLQSVKTLTPKIKKLQNLLVLIIITSL